MEALDFVLSEPAPEHNASTRKLAEDMDRAAETVAVPGSIQEIIMINIFVLGAA